MYSYITLIYKNGANYLVELFCLDYTRFPFHCLFFKNILSTEDILVAFISSNMVTLYFMLLSGYVLVIVQINVISNMNSFLNLEYSKFHQCIVSWIQYSYISIHFFPEYTIDIKGHICFAFDLYYNN